MIQSPPVPAQRPAGVANAKRLARYRAVGARFASRFAPSRLLHHLLGHDRVPSEGKRRFPNIERQVSDEHLVGRRCLATALRLPRDNQGETAATITAGARSGDGYRRLHAGVRPGLDAVLHAASSRSSSAAESERKSRRRRLNGTLRVK